MKTVLIAAVTMKTIIVLLLLSCLCCMFDKPSIKNSACVGLITDVSVSVGGFGHNDKYVITVDSTRKLIIPDPDMMGRVSTGMILWQTTKLCHYARGVYWTSEQ